MNIDKLMGNPRVMQAVLGVSLGEFQSLVGLMEQAWFDVLKGRVHRQRAVGGGAKGKLEGGARKLLFILFYLKVYPTYDLMGVFFDLDRSECCRWTHKLLPVLERVLKRKLVLPKRQIRSVAEFAAAFPGACEVLVDGMERRIQRPKKPSSNRKHYSGKKKAHTRKAIVVADGTRRIGLLSRSKRGARHDKRIADMHGIIQSLPTHVSVIADTGFVGARHPGLCLPRKGSKRKPLSDEDRGWNRLVSSIRIRVEHAIGGMKRFAAVAGIYRNRKVCCDDRFNLLAAGLWNLHLDHHAA